jgi:hypothetical protein
MFYLYLYLVLVAFAVFFSILALCNRLASKCFGWDDAELSILIACLPMGLAFTAALALPISFILPDWGWVVVLLPSVWLLLGVACGVLWERLFRLLDPAFDRLALSLRNTAVRGWSRVSGLHDDYRFHQELERE